jgi:hypothetical protein
MASLVRSFQALRTRVLIPCPNHQALNFVSLLRQNQPIRSVNGPLIVRLNQAAATSPAAIIAPPPDRIAKPLPVRRHRPIIKLPEPIVQSPVAVAVGQPEPAPELTVLVAQPPMDMMTMISVARARYNAANQAVGDNNEAPTAHCDGEYQSQPANAVKWLRYQWCVPDSAYEATDGGILVPWLNV